MEPNITLKADLQPHPDIDEAKPSNKSTKRAAFSVLVVVVAALMAGVGYWCGNRNSGSRSLNGAQLAREPSAISNPKELQPHFVIAKGDPYDVNAAVITKLALPPELQGVVTPSDNNNRGEEQFFTDKYNDELARYSVGYSDDSGSNSGGVSDVSFLAIGKSWLASTTDNSPDPLGYLTYDTTGPINTPVQKTQYLAKLKKDTSDCATDAKKGFKTSGDISLNVCYNLGFGKDGYHPYMTLYGYSDTLGEPIVMFGGISIYDSTSPDLNNFDASHQAIQDANNGKYTPGFKKALDDLLLTLPKTEISKAPRQ